MEEMYKINGSLAVKLLWLTHIRKSLCKADLLWRADEREMANIRRLPRSFRYAKDNVRTILLLSDSSSANAY